MRRPFDTQLRRIYVPLVGRGAVTFMVGAPALFAIAMIAVGAAVYFALGLVAGDALGLTPVAFLIAALFFVATMMTYVEGNSLHRERGGASTFARYAFNEFWSFVAGWAILLDLLIVMAIAAFSVSHYLAAFWGEAGAPGAEIVVAGLAIAWVAWANVRGVTVASLRFLARLGLVNIALALALVVIAAIQTFDADLILDSVELWSSPEFDDFLFACVIAGVALTGIEAASGLAGEIIVGRRGLRKVVIAGSAGVFVLFLGLSVVGLTAVPVVDGSTALGDRYEEAPVLGIVSAFDPSWLRDAARYAVGAMAAMVLLQAVNVNMLGVSRLAYSLATNRQIPSLFGRLHPVRSTPFVAIGLAAVIAFGLTFSGDLELLAGIFAFGALLAFTLAHASVIALRFREPDLPSAYRIPGSIPIAGASVPLPAVGGAVAAAVGWVSVLVLHEGARTVGLIWMAAGITLYVVYRTLGGKPLAKRFTIPEDALRDREQAEYGSILVPVFGTELDDDIVGTAGRLAAEEGEEGEGGAMIEALYVIEMPMSLPLDARVPEERIAEANRALQRAKDVGEEYEGVLVATATTRARSAGEAIVAEAKRRGVEAIVLAAEAPTRMRGGARLGGLAGPRDRFVGDMTEYVVRKAPCRVVLTAAPAGEAGDRAGVKP